MGYGEGEGRVRSALQDALNSPLLNDNDVYNAKKILINLSFADSKKENDALMMEEITELHEFMARIVTDFEIKWGVSLDPDLGSKVKVTILATGFGVSSFNRTKTDVDEARKDRYGEYYPNGTKDAISKRKKFLYRFRYEDLDNEDIILSVENTPTFSRTRQMLESIGHQDNGINPEKTTDDNDRQEQRLISFS